MRRILITLPHDTLLRAEGHRERLLGILGLLPQLETAWVAPDSLLERAALNGAPLYTFHEPSVGKLRVPYVVDWAPSFRATCKRAIEEFQPDLVLCDLPWGVRIVAKHGIPTVYLSHGVERDFTDTTLLHLGIPYFPFTSVARGIVGAIERVACTRASLTVAMSESDVARYRSLYRLSTSSAVAVSQPVPLGESRPDRLREESRARFGLAEDELACVFHGSWHHVPNREAVRALQRTIAPRFDQRRIRFIVAGTGMEPFREGAVEGIGFVESLADLLAAADLAVLPILHGAGVRMKTFDYVRAGVPIVATAKALEGVQFRDGVHAAISDDSIGGFAERMERALGERELWSKYSQNAFAHVAAVHDPATLATMLRGQLETLLRESSGKRAPESRPLAANETRRS